MDVEMTVADAVAGFEHAGSNPMRAVVQTELDTDVLATCDVER